MKILADENMPYAEYLFSQFGNVVLKHGRYIVPEDLIDVDILMVRSITKVNPKLLSKANKLCVVGTATAGFDHIDIDYLYKKGISYTNSQGCNKISVGEYVLSSLLFLGNKYHLDLSKLSIGIIGDGCTGSEVAKRCNALGMNILSCDPYREGCSTVGMQYVSFEETLKADILTFHVPLTVESDYPTYHMMSKNTLNAFGVTATTAHPKFIINASRGEVISDLDLLDTLKSNPNVHLIKDVWEGEPNINCKELIKYADIATPHIAGYAYEAKCRGTYMLYEFLCNKFGQNDKISFASLLKQSPIRELTISDTFDQSVLRRIVNLVYDVNRDSEIFKTWFKDGESFDNMRKNYEERRELSSISIKGITNSLLAQKLHELGFFV
ncbi:MAG: 4-phosphoerythronate dehydrogenase [Succinivibrionaceae bacterium]